MFNKNKLVKALENKKWSAYKLWKVSGVSQSVISDIINGKVKNPTVKTLSKIADALGVSVNEFFDGEDCNSTTNEKYIDKDIRRIERARKKMNPKDKEKMMKILEASFEDYFDED